MKRSKFHIATIGNAICFQCARLIMGAPITVEPHSHGFLLTMGPKALHAAKEARRERPGSRAKV